MGIKNIAILLISAVMAAQPEGVSDTLYDCNYDDTQATYLEIKFDDEIYKCGEGGAIRAPKLEETSPLITLNGAEDDSYYTIILSNPDDMIPIAPIIHHMIVNVKGSDFKNGFTDDSAPSDADTLIAYYRPSPPIPFIKFTYSYLVYKQNNGDTDFSAMDTSNIDFDIEGVASTYNLSFVDSNYFLSKGTVWSSMTMFLGLIWNALTFWN